MGETVREQTKSKGGGFQRGFLLSKKPPKPKTKNPLNDRPTTTSVVAPVEKKSSQEKDGFQRGFLLAKKPPKPKTKKENSTSDVRSEGDEKSNQENNNALDVTSVSKTNKILQTPNLTASKQNESSIPSTETTGRPTSTSLLDWEDDEDEIFSSSSPKTSSLGEDAKPRSMLQIVDHRNKSEKTEKQSPFKSEESWIESIDKDDDENNSESNDFMGMVEIKSTTIRRKRGSLISEEYTPMDHSETGAQQATTNGNSVSEMPESLCPDNIMSQDFGPNNQDYQNDGMTTNFLKCQRDLDRTLWKMRRKRPRKESSKHGKGSKEHNKGAQIVWYKIGKDFVHDNLLLPPTTNEQESINTELLAWAWDSLFMACPKMSAQCWAEVRLALVILLDCTTIEAPKTATTAFTDVEKSWRVFVFFLTPRADADKRERVLTLGTITMLELWCSLVQQKEQGEDASPVTTMTVKWMADLMTHVVPPLRDQIRAQSTLTVLAQRCTIAIYNLVATILEQSFHEGYPDNEQQRLQETMWMVCCDNLESVLDQQLVWNSCEDAKRIDPATSARNGCKNAVLENWKNELKDAKALESGPETTHHREWCNVLRGEPLVPGDVTAGSFVGSLQQTFLKDKVALNEDDILICLERASEWGKQNASANVGFSAEERKRKQVAMARAVVAWLGQSKKRMFSLCNHQRVLELTSMLIRCALNESVVQLALKILIMLFAETSGVPSDVNDLCGQDSPDEPNRAEVPASLKYWIGLSGDNQTKSDCDQLSSIIEASQETISRLIATSVVRISPQSQAAISKQAVAMLVSQNGMTMLTLRVLMNVLQLLQPEASKMDDGKILRRGDLQEFYDHITCGILLERFQSDRLVLEAIRRGQEEEFDCFYLSSLDIVVPKLIRLIVAILPDSNGEEAAAMLVSSLTGVLHKSLGSGDDETESFSTKTVETLMALKEGGGKSPETKEQTPIAPESIEQACSLFGSSWRQLVLEGGSGGSSGLSIEAFGSFIKVVGSEMFRYPESTVPLALFGALVGDSTSYNFATGKHEQTRAVIVHAAMSVMELSVAELGGLQSKLNGGNLEKESIFSRLAPLLLLRRIPPNFFQMAYKEMSRSQQTEASEIKGLLRRIADHLAARLDIDPKWPAKSQSEVMTSATQFSAEERQMAAEVAGRCLPFDEQSAEAAADVLGSVSCFRRVCIPGFSGMLDVISSTGAELEDETRNRIRRARAALYTTCHFIPFAKDNGAGWVQKPLIATAAFCLRCLHANEERFETEVLEKEFLQLQSGCIEFFAVCIEEHFYLRSPSRQSTECFQRIYQIAVELIQTGSISSRELQEQLTAGEARILNPHSNENSVESGSLGQKGLNRSYSVACYTCLWNSFIVVSQRCPGDGGKLQLLSGRILPWLLSWGRTSMEADNGGRESRVHNHPLCVTAALQLAFILVTRSKSFACLVPSPCAAQPSDSSVQMLYRWALWAVSSGKDDASATDYAKTALRCAGLKMMLAVVTIGKIAISENHTVNKSSTSSDASVLVVTPKELEETFSMLKEVAKDDPDPKVQALAAHILGAAFR